MAVVTVGNLPSKVRRFLQSPPKIAAQIKPNSALPPPLYLSTNPSHVDPFHLRDLYADCNHSCHRFPQIDAAGRVDPVDSRKLRTAISNSSVVVTVFTRPEFVTSQTSTSADGASLGDIGGIWMKKVAPLTPGNGRLVGFGRAVSDLALTASIYDVMVHPDFRGKGIGRTIVKGIIRMLINRGIYDIAALCDDNERLFFKACGFGEDMLESTTMMYARSGCSSCSEEEQMISAGRKMLLLPPQREFRKYCK